MFTSFTPETRKRIYDVIASLNALVATVLPVLVTSQVIPQSTASQVVQIGASVLAVAALVLARQNVSIPAAPVVAEDHPANAPIAPVTPIK